MVDPVLSPDRPSLLCRHSNPIAIAVALLGASLLWAYWPALLAMERKWAEDPRYSHGYLVPLFSLYLLWSRRDRLGSTPYRPSWWGVAAVVAGMAAMLAGTRYFFGWIESASLLPCLTGLVLLAGGQPALRRARPSIAFLIFMIPLPYRVEMALGAPLQGLATACSTYALQTLGLPALAEGHVILLSNHVRLGVAEACNGLGMLVMFLAYATAAALVVRRPALDRALLALSAVPIALGANVARIVVTGVLESTAGHQVAGLVYHDLAGWLMMPLALATLWAELHLLSHLLIEPAPTTSPSPVLRSRSTARTVGVE